MNAAVSLIVVCAATMQAKDDSASRESARSKHERILEIYTGDAAEFTIYRDASRKDMAELRREPVLVCSNPARGWGWRRLCVDVPRPPRGHRHVVFVPHDGAAPSVP